MTVTRPVILDLWPAYASGEASQDTRALVDAFLRDDPEFARQLREDPLSQLDGPAPSPDLELRALAKARRRLGGFRSLLFLAIMFSCMAFGRIVSDTSFDVSPRAFIAVASIAAAFWIAFFVTLFRMRGRILIVPAAGARGGFRAQDR
jgi:anti-sigma factor RsiW